jgi:hypothetical protein
MLEIIIDVFVITNDIEFLIRDLDFACSLLLLNGISFIEIFQ